MKTIEFNSLLEALQHHPVCPLCRSAMLPNCRAFSFEKNGYLTFDLNTPEDLRIDFPSDIVAWVPRLSGSFSTTKRYTGTLLQGISLECHDCSNFGYVLALNINLNTFKVAQVSLNSEIIRWKDEHKTLHEIKSIYSMDYSEYVTLPTNKLETFVIIPLIPINILDPQETVARAQALTVFS